MKNLVWRDKMIFKVARAELHHYEEPVISGVNGSGTIFFSGCTMRCAFCQNYEISRGKKGVKVTEEELLRLFFSLEEEGAHNINLVTPSHYALPLIPVLEEFKKRSTLPVLYNTNAYESVDNLKRLEGLIDIYLPDFKYVSDALSVEFSKAKGYGEKAYEAIKEMQRQIPENVIVDGLMKKGLIVRHLVLPSCTEDSKAVLDALASLPQKPLLSLMAQYFPTEEVKGHKILGRKTSKLEYAKVLDYANVLGFEGYSQSPESATKDYTPEFDLSLVEKRLNRI